MPIDPFVSLAFAVYTSPGVYALLLGSGVSRSAQIPTGWELVLDLADKVADLREESTDGDPARWYRERLGRDLEYSVLLEELAAEPAERQRLLRPYFEPTDEEREQGVKVPTAAHRAIARLVRSGYVRVIVTTNFDRLLERAVEEAGVTPITISTPDAVDGASPLAHTDCTIVKVHGDYLDSRISNTRNELDSYDPRIDRLLDRVFDEYGLIICGWSGEWDTALRNAIDRCPTRRFTTYWAARGELRTAATPLRDRRRALVVPITNADTFLSDLEQKVVSLAAVEAPHPLTAKAAVATLKRYLPEDRHRIRLHDLLTAETERVIEQTGVDAFPTGGDATTPETFVERLERYEAICEPLVSILATGARWARPEQRAFFVAAVERLANRWATSSPGGGSVPLIDSLLYPAVLAMYASGVGAVAGKQLSLLAELLGGVEHRWYAEDRRPVVLGLAPARLVELGPGSTNRRTPISDRLCDVLREPLRELVPSDADYTDTFDRFEYLYTLAFADCNERAGLPLRGPVGSYVWRRGRRGEDSLFDAINAEARAAGDSWAFLQGPLFNGSLERFLHVKDAVDQGIRESLGRS